MDNYLIHCLFVFIFAHQNNGMYKMFTVTYISARQNLL